MKILIALILFALISSYAQAENRTLGVPDGKYQGQGKLISQDPWVPNTTFKSVRIFKNGVIEASTTAYLLGVPVAKAQARLKFVPNTKGKLDVIDLNNPKSKPGSASCAADRCTFSTTVMNGDLTLSETFVPGGNGFQVVNGGQIFKGKPALYEAVFERVD